MQPLLQIEEGGTYGEEEKNMDSSSGQPFEVLYGVGDEVRY